MSNELNTWKLAEGYLEGSLSEAELHLLNERISNDSSFATEFTENLNMLRSLKDNGAHKQFKQQLANVHNKLSDKPTPKTVSLIQNHWRTATIAACIAILTSLSTFWLVQHSNKKIASQYSLLRRDLEKYKRSQNKIIGDIKSQTSSPDLQARYTGTGFALTNNGYLATSYHVVNGADSVYIQSKNGNYYKAEAVAFNEATDVVILKVDDKHFKFADYEVPYTIANNKKKLGARVFTLGFPQDEIVYNEGYISAKNGYAGDTAQYRLDIPAGPGQSGAPVIDGSGNIIGIITGKESETEGTTFAVATESLHQLLETLPKENRIKLNTTNRLSRFSREKQIEKLEYYTCAIKVYKR